MHRARQTRHLARPPPRGQHAGHACKDPMRRHSLPGLLPTRRRKFRCGWTGCVHTRASKSTWAELLVLDSVLYCLHSWGSCQRGSSQLRCPATDAARLPGQTRAPILHGDCPSGTGIRPAWGQHAFGWDSPVGCHADEHEVHIHMQPGGREAVGEHASARCMHHSRPGAIAEAATMRGMSGEAH